MKKIFKNNLYFEINQFTNASEVRSFLKKLGYDDITCSHIQDIDATHVVTYVSESGISFSFYTSLCIGRNNPGIKIVNHDDYSLFKELASEIIVGDQSTNDSNLYEIF